MQRYGIYRQWIIANGAAEALGLGGTFVLGRLVAPHFRDDLGPVAVITGALAAVLHGVLLEGVLVGWAQARVLRHALPCVSSRSWILATAIGAGAAWALGMVPSTVMALIYTPGATGDAAGPAEPGAIVQYGLAFLLGAVTGPILGLAQMIVLRKHVRRAGRWLFANAAAWAIGMPLIFAGMDLLPWGEGGWLLFAGLMVTPGIAGLSAGAVVGPVLLSFCRERNKLQLAGD